MSRFTGKRRKNRNSVGGRVRRLEMVRKVSRAP